MSAMVSNAQVAAQWLLLLYCRCLGPFRTPVIVTLCPACTGSRSRGIRTLTDMLVAHVPLPLATDNRRPFRWSDLCECAREAWPRGFGPGLAHY
jgi:hypothetical protein